MCMPYFGACSSKMVFKNTRTGKFASEISCETSEILGKMQIPKSVHLFWKLAPLGYYCNILLYTYANTL